MSETKKIPVNAILRFALNDNYGNFYIIPFHFDNPPQSLPLSTWQVLDDCSPKRGVVGHGYCEYSPIPNTPLPVAYCEVHKDSVR